MRFSETVDAAESTTSTAVDTVVVRAAIHPAIGIARIGDSPDQFFIGPEVVEPAAHGPDFYRDPVTGVPLNVPVSNTWPAWSVTDLPEILRGPGSIASA